MDFKPDEKIWMAFLYDELEGEEKDRMVNYSESHTEAREELKKFQEVRQSMAGLNDKEVIAPPIFLSETSRNSFWASSFIKRTIGLAASLALLIIVAKTSDLRVRYADKELSLGFGEVKQMLPDKNNNTGSTLTAVQVQQMIRSSLEENNQTLQAAWSQSQDKIDASISEKLALNNARIDRLVREVSLASREQIAEYAAGIQIQNKQVVKDYFKLSSDEQKNYLEDLLVDFAKYLQQQRNDDLKLVNTRLNNIEQNTDLFKQETEQILTSLITGTTKNSISTKN